MKTKEVFMAKAEKGFADGPPSCEKALTLFIHADQHDVPNGM